MAANEAEIAVMKERLGFLVGKTESLSGRVQNLENISGNTVVDVRIIKEQTQRHGKILIGDGEEASLTEEVRGLRYDFSEFKTNQEKKDKEKVTQIEKGNDRWWQIYIAIGLLILREVVTWWLSNH